MNFEGEVRTMGIRLDKKAGERTGGEKEK